LLAKWINVRIHLLNLYSVFLIYLKTNCVETIKVRFFETDNGDADGEIIWDSCGKFSPSDVHHQFGIVFKTPPYKNANIGE